MIAESSFVMRIRGSRAACEEFASQISTTEEDCVIYTVIYSTYIKKDEVFRQSRKEDIYVLLLSKIVASLEQETEIIYDTFNKHDFEERINATIAPFSHITSIHSADSRTEAGLQFVDNLCSVIRLYEAGKDHYSFYQIIADRVKMI